MILIKLFVLKSCWKIFKHSHLLYEHKQHRQAAIWLLSINDDGNMHKQDSNENFSNSLMQLKIHVLFFSLVLFLNLFYMQFSAISIEPCISCHEILFFDLLILYERPPGNYYKLYVRIHIVKYFLEIIVAAAWIRRAFKHFPIEFIIYRFIIVICIWIEKSLWHRRRLCIR